MYQMERSFGSTPSKARVRWQCRLYTDGDRPHNVQSTGMTNRKRTRNFQLVVSISVISSKILLILFSFGLYIRQLRSLGPTPSHHPGEQEDVWATVRSALSILFRRA